MTLFNAVVVTGVFQQATYPLVAWMNVDIGPELPSLPTILWQLFVSVIVVEIGFYYFHR